MAIAGRVSIVPKGAYVSGNTYTRLDMVTHNGCVYVAKKNTTVEPTGLLDTDDWMFIIESDRQGIDDLQTEVDEVNSNIATNLLKPTLATTTKNGVVCTNNGDGTYTLNGTATGLTYFQFYPKFSVDTGIYTLSGHSSIENDVYLWCDEKTKAYKGSFELLSSNRYYLTIRVNSGQVYDNVVVKPMLEVGTVAHDFVPYTGDSGRLNEDVASKMPKSAMSNSKVITTKGESVADSYELNEANSDSYAKSVKDKFDAVNDSLAWSNIDGAFSPNTTYAVLNGYFLNYNTATKLVSIELLYTISKSLVAGTDYKIGQIADGYRPVNAAPVHMAFGGSNNIIACYVKTDGSVTIRPLFNNVSVDGVYGCNIVYSTHKR